MSCSVSVSKFEMPQLCRYFANGICSKGNSCTFSHDAAKRNEDICQFNLIGKCSFGQACRFLHTRPRNDERPSASSSRPNQNSRQSTSASSSSNVPRVKPVQLEKKPAFNVQAKEFVPSWKMTAPSSYASACSSSQPSVTSNQLCPYFTKNGECHRQDTDCPFVHGDHCDMCNSWALHPFDEEMRKNHQAECLSSHTREMERAFLLQKAESKSCGICMENIVEKNLRFGILNGCQHCFCLDCIRQWRSRSRDQQSVELATKTVRSCPECRQHSDYVIPSMFWVDDGQEKQLLIEMYKENTKNKVCKYYSNTSSRGNCPFGNKCFYKHQLPDGSIDPGESPHVRRRARLNEFIFPADYEDDDSFDYDTDDEFDLDRMLDEMMIGDERSQMLNSFHAMIADLRRELDRS